MIMCLYLFITNAILKVFTKSKLDFTKSPKIAFNSNLNLNQIKLKIEIMKTKIFYFSTLLATTLSFGSCNHSKAETLAENTTLV